MSVVCLGEPLGEFRQNGDRSFVFGFGGDVCNCAVAVSRSGGKSSIVTRLGNDWLADAFHDLWSSENIDSTGVTHDSTAHTGLYFLTHHLGKHSFEYRRRNSAAAGIHPALLPGDLIRSSSILHFSGISQAISKGASDTVFAAIQAAKAAGKIVSYDPNLRLALWTLERAKSTILDTLQYCDILLPSLDDSRQLLDLSFPDDIIDRYLSFGVKTVALTLGDQGAIIATSERRKHMAAHDVRAIDATGAGDAFDGAFLADFLATNDPFHAGEYANAAAALATTQFGAVSAIPTRSNVLKLLQREQGRAH